MAQGMSLTDKLAQEFTAHRVLVAFIAISVTLVAAMSLPWLRVDDDFNRLLQQAADDPSRGLEIEKDDAACVLLLEGGQILAPGNQDAVRELVYALSENEHVRTVHSIFDARKPVRFGRYVLPLISRSPESDDELRELQQQALSHPLIKDKMLSSDGCITMIVAELDPTLQRAGELAPVLETLREIAREQLAGTPLEASITGIPALQVEMSEALKWEQIFFVAGAELVGLLICFLIFRRLAAVIIVQAGPLSAVVWSLGGMALFGEPLNVVNSVLAPLVLTIALTDSVHLMLRVRSAREQGMSRLEAVKLTLARVGPACFLTSLTTAVAFGSLSAAHIEIIRRFGLACGGSVVLAFAAVITVVPLLACTRLGDYITRRSPTEALTNSFLAARLDGLISRWRWSIATVAMVATGVLLVISMRLQPDIQMQQFLPRQGAALNTLKQCDEVFNGLLPIYVQIQWDEGTQQSDLMQATRAVEQIIESEPMLAAPLSIYGLLQSMSKTPDEPVQSLAPLKGLPPEKVERLVNFQQHETIVIARIRDIGTKNVAPLKDKLNAEFRRLESRWPNLHFRLTGWTVSAGRLSASMLNDMLISLYIAVFVSFLILTIAFRSIKLGLVSFVPNLFPLAATGATMVYFDIPLQFSSATVFSVCFGIAVDDTIHFLSAYTHETRQGTRSRVAIRRALVRVGEALVASTLIMLAAFCVVLFSSVPSIQVFALVFIIVLVWALMGDLIFLPALLSFLPDKIAPKAKRMIRASSAAMVEPDDNQRASA